MKRIAVVATLVMAMAIGMSSLAMAGRGGRGDCGPGQGTDMGPGPGMGGPGGFYTRMAKALKLTDAQKSQIKALMKSEREGAKPLMEKIFESRKQLRQAGETTSFDEAAVRSIVAGMAQTEADLAVLRVKTHSQIYTILTPEQREAAKTLKPQPRRGPKNGPPPFDE